MESRDCVVAYYSRSGNVEYLAEAIAASLGCDLLPLQPIKAEGSNKTVGITPERSLFRLILTNSWKLDLRGFIAERYASVFLGAPVWFGTAAPPAARFLEEIDRTAGRIAVFTCGILPRYRNRAMHLYGPTIGAVKYWTKHFSKPFAGDERRITENAVGWAKWIYKG